MAIINGTSVGGMTLQADYSYTQNTSANTSNVTVILKLANHYALYSSALSGSYISVGGSKTNYSKTISYGGSTTTTTELTRKTVTITHKSDGTATCNISGTFVMNGTYRGSSVGTMSVNQTITLPTIPRSSSLTVPTSISTGTTLSGTVTPSSSSFNHKIYIKVGSSVKNTISLSAGTTAFSDVIEHSWFPSTTSGTVTVTLETYNGSTLIATTSKNVTANVPTSVAPSVTAFTAAIAANGLSGLYVQGKTTATLSATATVAGGATIKSYTYSGPNVTASANSVTVVASTITTAAIKSSGTLTYTVKVQDSRGRTASKSLTISVQAYSNPTIGPVAVQRCDANGNISQSGTYARYTVNSSYASVGGKNTRTVTVAYSSNNGTSYSAETTLQAATDTANTKTGTYGGSFAIASTYILRFTIKDAYGATKTITAPLQSAERPININWNGKGVSIGAMSTKQAFEVSMPAEFNDALIAKSDLTVNGNMTLNGAFTHYGLGGIAKVVSGDWNTACGDVTGFFRGAQLTNSPALAHDWLYVVQIAHSSVYKTQIAFNYYGGDGIFRRVLSNNAWSEWKTVVFDSNFTQDFDQAGYTKLPNGFIVQWGAINIPANTTYVDVRYPIAFPTLSRSVVCQNAYSNNKFINYAVSSVGQTHFRLMPFISTTGNVPTVVSTGYWLAIGN